VLDGLGHHSRTRRLVTAELVGRFEDSDLAAKKGHATAGHDALFDGGLRRRHRVFDAVLLLFQLDFGRGANLDDGDATGQLGRRSCSFSRS